MATKTVLSLVASLALVVNGCGGGDKAAAKQAALAPASVERVKETAVDVHTGRSHGCTAAVLLEQPLPPLPLQLRCTAHHWRWRAKSMRITTRRRRRRL